MDKIGNRYFYVISVARNWEGLESNVIYISHNKKEAINRFRWLYEGPVYEDFTNEDDEEYFQERDYSIRPDSSDPNIIRGYFYYTDDDGECDYQLDTIKTNTFWSFTQSDTYLEGRYKTYVESLVEKRK